MVRAWVRMTGGPKSAATWRRRGEWDCPAGLDLVVLV